MDWVIVGVLVSVVGLALMSSLLFQMVLDLTKRHNEAVRYVGGVLDDHESMLNRHGKLLVMLSCLKAEEEDRA